MSIKRLTTGGAQAGGTYTWTVPDNRAYKILFGHVVFVADGTVINRNFNISIKDSSSNDLFDSAAGPVQTASQTRHYNLVTGGNFRENAFYNNSTECNVPIPDALICLPGDTITIEDALGPVAGDTINAIINVLDVSVNSVVKNA